MAQEMSYMIADGRARYDIDRSTILECCDSLSEARKNLKDYEDACILEVDETGYPTVMN